MRAVEDESTPFEDLVREVRLAFHQLKASAEALHEDSDGLTAAHRGVLESLHRDGRGTVPALARARPVSRQHIQVLVNRLIELGLVESLPNPAHRRSSVLALTSAGKRRFEAMQKRERRAIARARVPLTAVQMEQAAATLRALRASLASIVAHSHRR